MERDSNIGPGSGRLELKGIVKRFGGVVALSGVDFAIDPGEVVCVAGENGAGKSTLGKVIAGSYPPDEGTITIGGQVVEMRSPRDAHDAGIRVVPQELSLVPDLSVAENISLGQLPKRWSGTVDRARMREIAVDRLQRLRLQHIDVDVPVEGLPVVDKAFVQIARAMTPDARFLIADEPTAPMSGEEADRLIDLLTSIRAAGVGVVFISHRLDEVYRLADRITVLRDSRNALTGALSDVTRNELVRAMVGSDVAPFGQATQEVRDGDMPLLSVRGLRSGTIEDLALEVHRFEILGVYGSTGSGREQVGPALFGAVKRRAGTIRVDGREVQASSPRRAIADGIGYVPAERRAQALLLDLSVRQNLTMAATSRFTRRGLLRKKAEVTAVRNWMDRLELKAGSTEVAVGTLSGGTQQKVVLARWMMMDLPVLVLDEPTRGVDVGTKREIYAMLRDLADAGTAVVVISSDAEELELAADRVLVMRAGRVHAELMQPTQEQILTGAQELVAAA